VFARKPNRAEGSAHARVRAGGHTPYAVELRERCIVRNIAGAEPDGVDFCIYDLRRICERNRNRGSDETRRGSALGLFIREPRTEADVVLQRAVAWCIQSYYGVR
jgi:hypothetical protein